MGTFFSALIGKSGLILLAVTVIAVSLAIVARNWSCRAPKPPRVVTESFTVVSCPTGASIEVKSGRRTRMVYLTGIAAPLGGVLAEESRGSLEKAAGATIRVEWEKRRIFGAEAPESGEMEVRKTFEDWPQVTCPNCNGTGVGELTPQDIANSLMGVWCNGHLPKCEQCRRAMVTESSDKHQFCKAFQDKWGKISKQLENTKTVTQSCPYCRGKGYMHQQAESRGPIEGTVYGESGQCLQECQLAQGLATTVGDAPKAWKSIEAKAKREKKGVWAK